MTSPVTPGKSFRAIQGALGPWKNKGGWRLTIVILVYFFGEMYIWGQKGTVTEEMKLTSRDCSVWIKQMIGGMDDAAYAQ